MALDQTKQESKQRPCLTNSGQQSKRDPNLAPMSFWRFPPKVPQQCPSSCHTYRGCGEGGQQWYVSDQNICETLLFCPKYCKKEVNIDRIQFWPGKLCFLFTKSKFIYSRSQPYGIYCLFPEEVIFWKRQMVLVNSVNWVQPKLCPVADDDYGRQ